MRARVSQASAVWAYHQSPSHVSRNIPLVAQQGPVRARRGDPLLRVLEGAQAAYHQQRPLESRITGLVYAPWTSTRDGGEIKFDYVARDRAANLLIGAALEHPGPATRHALGRLYLTNREFDKAIQQMEEALKAEPSNAQLHSDLGAAYLDLGSFGSFIEMAGAMAGAQAGMELPLGGVDMADLAAMLPQDMVMYLAAEDDRLGAPGYLFSHARPPPLLSTLTPFISRPPPRHPS